jgi:sterol 14alpha-demethylase
MQSVYKDGTPVPEHECSHMMTGLLMAGQHSSSVTSAWTMLHLAAQPDVMEEHYQEQLGVFGGKLERGLQLGDVHCLPLHHNVVRETLRLNPPIHSIMRKAKNTLPVEGTGWAIPAGYVLLASPAMMSYSSKYFPNPEKWDPHRWEKIADPEEEKDKVVLIFDVSHCFRARNGRLIFSTKGGTKLVNLLRVHVEIMAGWMSTLKISILPSLQRIH